MNALQMYLEAKNREELQLEIMLLSQISGEVQQYFDWQMQTSNPESFELVPYKEEILKALYDSFLDNQRINEIERIISCFESDKKQLSLYFHLTFFVLLELHIYIKNKEGFTKKLLQYGVELFHHVLELMDQHVNDADTYQKLKEELRTIMEKAPNFNDFHYHKELYQIFNHY